MRGAAYLSGLADAMVIDVGGTTTDVGQLKLGFPREANSVVKVGGVRTLFRMPDLLSIGLGGGSHVTLDPLKVGPVSVGYRLLKDGIAFGGGQLTTTDIAIATDVLKLGDKKKVAHLSAATCRAAMPAQSPAAPSGWATMFSVAVVCVVSRNAPAGALRLRLTVNVPL